jgi:hypothetical protein
MSSAESESSWAVEERVLFASASQWVDRLAEAHTGGPLQAELVRLARYPPLVIDEVLSQESRPVVPEAPCEVSSGCATSL